MQGTKNNIRVKDTTPELGYNLICLDICEFTLLLEILYVRRYISDFLFLFYKLISIDSNYIIPDKIILLTHEN